MVDVRLHLDTGDGLDDWAGATGSSGSTLGIAPCDPSNGLLGFGSNDTDADTAWSDPGGTTTDASVHYTYEATTIAAGEAVSYGFYVGVGTSEDITSLYTIYAASGALSIGAVCSDCDDDGDGSFDVNPDGRITTSSPGLNIPPSTLPAYPLKS